MVPRFPAPAVLLLLLAAIPAGPLYAAGRDVIIVAGQSNTLNRHAAASALPASPDDAAILFYFETGAPPARGGDHPFDSTSGGRWTTLGAQRQGAFIKYERDFFGPEISLARALTRAGVAPLGVSKVAYFGTNLAADWQPGAATGNRLYERLQENVGTACRLLRFRGDEPRLAGFFWMQGETDGANTANAHAYAENLAAFIRRVRADFNTPELPFVLGRVGPRPPKGYACQDVVRAAQVRIADNMPYTRWVDTDDQARDSDGVHLLAPGVITLGERMAAARLQRRGPSRSNVPRRSESTPLSSDRIPPSGIFPPR